MPTHFALTAIASPAGVTSKSDPSGTDQVTTEVRSGEVPSE
jgi:hypothetical protein